MQIRGTLCLFSTLVDGMPDDFPWLISLVNLLICGRPICNRAAWAGHIYFHPVVSSFFLSSFFFSLPNLSGRRLDVYHTSTHGMALV